MRKPTGLTDDSAGILKKERKRMESYELYPIAAACAPQRDFQPAGIALRHSQKQEQKGSGADLSATRPCAAGCVYTQNKVKGAPIHRDPSEHLQNGMAQAIICNSGNANTCNADGVEKAQMMCALSRPRRWESIAGGRIGGFYRGDRPAAAY